MGALQQQGGGDGTGDPGRVLLLIERDRDRSLLASRLDHAEVVVGDPNETLPDFDLCLVDTRTYPTAADRLRERKDAADPRYLPVLLVAEGRRTDAVVRGLDGVADDVLSLPTSEAVLRARVDSLLQTRTQSCRLDDQRERLELYRRAVDQASSGITIADAEDDQPLTYVNERFNEMTGYDAEDVLGENCRLLQGPDTDPEPVTAMREAVAAGDPVEVELRNYRADGEPFWNHVEISPVYDDEGELTHFLGFQQDVTERHELETEVREEVETLNTVFDTSPVGITVLNTDGEIARANETAEAVLGLERSAVVGRTFDAPEWEIVDEHGDPIPADDLPFSRVMETGEPVRGYEHGIRGVEDTRWLSVNAAPLTGDDGDVTGVVATVDDITARKEQNRALNRSLDLLGRTEEIADVGGWEIDVEAGEVAFTDGLARLLGIDPETTTDLETAFGYYHPEDRDAVRTTFERLLTTEVPQEIECRVVTASGEIRWVHIRGVSRTVDDRQVARGALVDITKRKEREHELEETVRQLRQTRDIADVAAWRYDVEHDEVWWSERVWELFGLPPSFEATADTVAGLYEPRSRQRFERVLRRAIVDGDPFDVEIKGSHGDAEWWAQITGEPQTEDGRTRSVEGVVRNVTERKRREQNLEQYERIVENTSDFIYSFDDGLRLTLVNEATAAVTGLSKSELVGTHVTTVFDESHAEALQNAIGDLDADGGPQRFESTLKDVDGTTRELQTTVSRTTPDVSGSRTVVCVSRDITELRERERRLSVLDRVLRHNLRNKINIVTASADLLQEATDDESVRSTAATIERNATGLLSIAETAREFHSTLDPAATDSVRTADVAERVRTVVSETRDTYDGVSLTADVPVSLPARIHETFDIALSELLTNAVSHSEDPATVHVSVTEDCAAQQAVVRVSDRGSGIPEVEREALTSGLESPLQHTTGLGLWFVRWMAVNSGGAIDVSANEPTGTVVELRFPLPAERCDGSDSAGR